MPAETACVPPVISRNSAIGAVPARSFPKRKTSVSDMREPIIIKQETSAPLAFTTEPEEIRDFYPLNAAGCRSVT